MKYIFPRPVHKLPTIDDLGPDETLHSAECACCGYEDGRPAAVAIIAKTTPAGDDATVRMLCETHGSVFSQMAPEVASRILRQHFEQLKARSPAPEHVEA